MRHFVVTCVCVSVAAGTVGCGSSDVHNTTAQGGNVNQAGSSQAGASQSTQGGGANGGNGNSNQGGGANGGNGTGVAIGGTGTSGAANTGGSGNPRTSGGTGTSGTADSSVGGGSASILTSSHLGAYDYGGCALNGAGKMLCWGSLPPSTETITPSASTFVTMSAAWEGACGITSSGGLECFDDPNAISLEGTCGLSPSGSIDCSGDPKFNTAGVSMTVTWSKVTGGGTSICALMSNGTPSCIDAFPQPPANGTFSDISVGEYHGCAIRQDTKELLCWTSQDVDVTEKIAPNGCFVPYALGQTNPPSGQYIRVVSGWLHSCAIGIDGTVACWGAGDPNDTSDYDNCSTPQRFNYGQGRPPSATFKQIAAGGYTTCGIKTDGTLACWGAGTTNNNCPTDISACGQAMPPSGTFTEVAVGYTHACAMTAAGKVQCWGSNTGGRATPPAELQ